MYWTHWHRFALDDRNSILRWIALFIASMGGAATALGSVGVMASTTLSWLLGGANERAALHFEDMPGVLVVASAGVIAWALFRRRMLIEAVGEYATPVRRIYDHLMAAFGLTALSGASFVIFNTALATFAEALSVSITDSDAWRSPVAAILAMLLIGVPVWGYYWRRLRLAYAADPESEATALSHRVYIFAILGAGALAFLGGGGGTLFVIPARPSGRLSVRGNSARPHARNRVRPHVCALPPIPLGNLPRRPSLPARRIRDECRQ